MWPMLAGLKPFLGDGPLGAFVLGQTPSAPWHAGDNVSIIASEDLRQLESAYVAVLQGPGTASSGEATAVAFRGRPRSRSFGLPTMGLASANANYVLPDGSMIALTIGIDADRTGRRYPSKLDPDEVIPTSSPGDAPLARAIEWLRAQPPCT
jgi:C-terminal processing protease CtpA/Prc